MITGPTGDSTTTALDRSLHSGGIFSISGKKEKEKRRVPVCLFCKHLFIKHISF